MNLRTRARTCWHLIRHGTLPADIEAEYAKDKAMVDEMVARFAYATVNDHLAARVAVDHYPLGKPRLTLVGSPR